MSGDAMAASQLAVTAPAIGCTRLGCQKSGKTWLHMHQSTCSATSLGHQPYLNYSPRTSMFSMKVTALVTELPLSKENKQNVHILYRD